MNLIYLRHAIAMEREEFATYCLKKGIESDDELRPLTKMGVRRMSQAAHGLHKALGSLDIASAPLIVSSPLKRARQTADIAAQIMQREGRVVLCDALKPGVEPEVFRNWLYEHMHSGARRRILNQQTIIAVGHEPSLSRHVTWWLTGEVKSKFPVKKGGAICLEIGNAMAPGQGRMMWALPPWALRALDD
ncbi:MAG: histidine phosphatase family protein [Bdellovibrionales bacterium]|nr:histidine phosphatase family protein [Bdellovibrionales bacterium]